MTFTGIKQENHGVGFVKQLFDKDEILFKIDHLMNENDHHITVYEINYTLENNGSPVYIKRNIKDFFVSLSFSDVMQNELQQKSITIKFPIHQVNNTYYYGASEVPEGEDHGWKQVDQPIATYSYYDRSSEGKPYLKEQVEFEQTEAPDLFEKAFGIVIDRFKQNDWTVPFHKNILRMPETWIVDEPERNYVHPNKRNPKGRIFSSKRA